MPWGHSSEYDLLSYHPKVPNVVMWGNYVNIEAKSQAGCTTSFHPSLHFLIQYSDQVREKGKRHFSDSYESETYDSCDI